MAKYLRFLVCAFLAVAAFTSQASAASLHVINDAWVLAQVYVQQSDSWTERKITLALGQKEKFETPGNHTISVEVRYLSLIKSYYVCGGKVSGDQRLTLRLEGSLFNLTCKEE